MIDRMRAFLRFILFVVIIAGVVGAVAWFWAGRGAGPTIDIRQPGQFVGQASTLELAVDAPGGKFSRVDVVVEQNGKTFPVFALDEGSLVSPGGSGVGVVAQENADRLYVMRPVGKRSIPELQAGPARIVARASRPVLYGLRQLESTVTRDVQVRLQSPRVAALSTFHFINH